LRCSPIYGIGIMKKSEVKRTNKIKCTDCQAKCPIYHAIEGMGHHYTEFENVHTTYKKKETICKQGSTVKHAMYILDGTAKLYIEGFNHRNIILNILKPGQYIGLLSFFEPVDYCYSVIALEDTTVCMIDLETVKDLYKNDHQLFVALNKAFASSASAIIKKFISINQKNIRGRMAEALLYLSELNNHHCFNLWMTRKELGEMCAISEENAVRILSAFKDEKIIETRGKEIKLVDIVLLKRISEQY
jgi:CRP/FNR family transcriptional regulator, polysaccharide utilization system transcription regulator